MRILHLCCSRVLTAGQRKQLRYEWMSAQRITDHTWDTLSFSVKPGSEPFERQLPVFFRHLAGRKLYAWIFMLRNWRKYDYILCRYLTFDPFAPIFSRAIKNRITVHHAKEEEELKLIRPGVRGVVASIIEKYSARMALPYAKGMLGVTREIATYEQLRIRRHLPIEVFPNGISYEEVSLMPDIRHSDHIHIAFVCGRFSSWHGLDSLLKNIELEYQSHPDFFSTQKIKLHLIGVLLESQATLIRQSQILSKITLCHGHMAQSDYFKVLSQCDVGLASFSLQKKRLKEASTLKVREYLAMGLPVYSGHIDTAIPKQFPFYRIGPPILEQITDYAVSMKSIPRTKIRACSKAFVEKEAFMRSVLDWLNSKID